MVLGAADGAIVGETVGGNGSLARRSAWWWAAATSTSARSSGLATATASRMVPPWAPRWALPKVWTSACARALGWSQSRRICRLVRRDVARPQGRGWLGLTVGSFVGCDDGEVVGSSVGECVG